MIMTTRLDRARAVGNRGTGQVSQFGKWVTEQREQRGLTKTEAAARCRPPLSVQRWAQIEYAQPRSKNGAPVQVSRNTCQSVADALAIPLSEVLAAAGYKPEMEDVPDKLALMWNELNEQGRYHAELLLQSLYDRKEYRKE